MVEDGAFSNKIDYVPIFKENLILEGHLNDFIGSKVTEILVNGGILLRGGVAPGRVCVCSLRSRLVYRGFRICKNLGSIYYLCGSLISPCVPSLESRTDHLNLGHGKNCKPFLSSQVKRLPRPSSTTKILGTLSIHT